MSDDISNGHSADEDHVAESPRTASKWTLAVRHFQSGFKDEITCQGVTFIDELY